MRWLEYRKVILINSRNPCHTNPPPPLIKIFIFSCFHSLSLILDFLKVCMHILKSLMKDAENSLKSNCLTRIHKKNKLTIILTLNIKIWVISLINNQYLWTHLTKNIDKFFSQAKSATLPNNPSLTKKWGERTLHHVILKL